MALDGTILRKTTRRGVYVMPEDDKDAQKLNDMKSMRVRGEGYSAPEEQLDHADLGPSGGNAPHLNLDLEEDIAYHNRYGAEEPHGPLDSGGRRMGYSDRE